MNTLENFIQSADMAAIYRGRRDRLRKLLIEAGLDAMLVSLAANRFYLSGFELHDPQFNESAGHLVISASGDDWLATDSRYEMAAQKLWPKDRVFIYAGNAPAALRHLLGNCGARIGLEPKSVSWAFARALTASGQGPTPAFEAAPPLVEGLRAIKDDLEIACMLASFHINNICIQKISREIHERAACGDAFTEKGLSRSIEGIFRDNGADLAFATIVARGPNAAMPHAIPGDETIGPDEAVLIDLGCRFHNYCSDRTRTFWNGQKPPEYFSRARKLVEDARRAAMRIMRPGVPCAKVYAAAMDVFEKAGMGGHFTHGLGHGIGLETHEAPSLNPRNTGVLRKGMVVTVEPGLYFPEWGGVRIEDAVLVEDDGIRIMEGTSAGHTGI